MASTPFQIFTFFVTVFTFLIWTTIFKFWLFLSTPYRLLCNPSLHGLKQAWTKWNKWVRRSAFPSFQPLRRQVRPLRAVPLAERDGHADAALHLPPLLLHLLSLRKVAVDRRSGAHSTNTCRLVKKFTISDYSNALDGPTRPKQKMMNCRSRILLLCYHYNCIFICIYEWVYHS